MECPRFDKLQIERLKVKSESNSLSLHSSLLENVQLENVLSAHLLQVFLKLDKSKIPSID